MSAKSDVSSLETPVDEMPRGIETEYKVIRDEILARIGMRQQIVGATLVFAATMVSVGVINPMVAFIYPPLAAFLAMAWAQNDFRIGDLSSYVRSQISPRFPVFGWEVWIASKRLGTGLRGWRVVVFAHGGLFIFTQIMAIFVGVAWLLKPPEQIAAWKTVVAWSLAICDLAAIGLVIGVLRKAKR